MFETPLRILYRGTQTGERGEVFGVVTHAVRPFSRYQASPWIGPLHRWDGVLQPLYRHYDTKRGAEQAFDKVVRVVRFMDCTGLTPTRHWSRAFGKWLPSGTAPGFDHTLFWRHDRSKLKCVTTEPYNYPVEDLCAWVRKHNWQMVVAPQFGMWYPPHTTLVVLAPPGGLDVAALMELANHEAD